MLKLGTSWPNPDELVTPVWPQHECRVVSKGAAGGPPHNWAILPFTGAFEREPAPLPPWVFLTLISSPILCTPAECPTAQFIPDLPTWV